jgi:hypothetical protein
MPMPMPMVRQVLDCVLLPRIEDLIATRAAKERMLKHIRRCLAWAVISGADFIGHSQERDAQYGALLVGLVEAMYMPIEDIGTIGGNIWNMMEECHTLSLDEPLRAAVNEAHGWHRRWSARF